MLSVTIPTPIGRLPIERRYNTAVRTIVFNLCTYEQNVSAREKMTVLLLGAHFLIADVRARSIVLKTLDRLEIGNILVKFFD